MNISFTVMGEPRGKGRPRAATRKKKIIMYTDTQTAAYESVVSLAAVLAMRANKAQPIIGACRVGLLICVPIPQSWSQRKKQSAISRELLPTGKPDIDNTIKAVFDACNGIVWRDDAIVTKLTAEKIYHEIPRVEVRVESD